MNKDEAEALLSFMEIDLSPGRARIRQLANGEHVIIIGGQETCFFIWDHDDWQHYREQISDRFSVNYRKSLAS